MGNIDYTGYMDASEPQQEQSRSRGVTIDWSGYMDDEERKSEPSISEQMKQEIKDGGGTLAAKAIAMTTAVGRRVATQQTPEELVAEGFSVAEATMISTAQEATMPFLSYGNALLGGLPSEIAAGEGVKDAFKQKEFNVGVGSKKIDIHPGIVNVPATIAGFTRGPLKLAGKLTAPVASAFTKAGAAGTAAIANGLKGAGLAGNVATKAAKIVSGTMAKDMTAGALQWGLASGINTPEGELANWEGRVTRGKIGAVGGAIFAGGANRIKKLAEITSRELAVARVLRGNIKGGFKNRSEVFNKSMYRATLQSPRQDISKDLSSLPKNQQAILRNIAGFGKKADKLKIPASKKVNILEAKIESVPGKIIKSEQVVNKDFSDVANLLNNKYDATPRQFQNAILHVKDALSKSKLSGKGIRHKDIDVKSLIENLQKIKHNRFPGTKVADRAYKSMSENLDVFENMKFGNTLSKMRSSVGDKEKFQALERITGKEFAKQIKSTVNFSKLSNQSAGLVTTFVKYGIVYKMMQKALRGKPQDVGGFDGSN